MIEFVFYKLMDVVFTLLMVILFITQVVIPLWIGLPTFWLFTRRGRRAFNELGKSFFTPTQKVDKDQEVPQGEESHEVPVSEQENKQGE